MALTIAQSSQIYGQRARLITYTGTDPAAGAEWSETVPAGKSWRIQAVRATLVTDATVATRIVEFVVDDGANILYLAYDSSSQLASLTNSYDGSIAATRAFTQVEHYIPLPEMILGPGYRIRSITAGIQAGDNWGAPVISVVETYE